MTLRGFAEYLLSIKPELQDKEVMVIAENGLPLPAKLKFLRIDEPLSIMEFTKENVKCTIITYE